MKIMAKRIILNLLCSYILFMLVFNFLPLSWNMRKYISCYFPLFIYINNYYSYSYIDGEIDVIPINKEIHFGLKKGAVFSMKNNGLQAKPWYPGTRHVLKGNIVTSDWGIYENTKVFPFEGGSAEEYFSDAAMPLVLEVDREYHYSTCISGKGMILYTQPRPNNDPIVTYVNKMPPSRFVFTDLSRRMWNAFFGIIASKHQNVNPTVERIIIRGVALSKHGLPLVNKNVYLVNISNNGDYDIDIQKSDYAVSNSIGYFEFNMPKTYLASFDRCGLFINWDKSNALIKGNYFEINNGFFDKIVDLHPRGNLSISADLVELDNCWLL